MDQSCPVVHISRRPQARLQTAKLNCEQIPKIGSGKKFWRNILFFKLLHNKVRYGRSSVSCLWAKTACETSGAGLDPPIDLFHNYSNPAVFLYLAILYFLGKHHVMYSEYVVWSPRAQAM
jgi:hypothetical protein